MRALSLLLIAAFSLTLCSCYNTVPLPYSIPGDSMKYYSDCEIKEADYKIDSAIHPSEYKEYFPDYNSARDSGKPSAKLNLADKNVTYWDVVRGYALIKSDTISGKIMEISSLLLNYKNILSAKVEKQELNSWLSILCGLGITAVVVAFAILLLRVGYPTL